MARTTILIVGYLTDKLGYIAIHQLTSMLDLGDDFEHPATVEVAESLAVGDLDYIFYNEETNTPRLSFDNALESVNFREFLQNRNLFNSL